MPAPPVTPVGTDMLPGLPDTVGVVVPPEGIPPETVFFFTVTVHCALTPPAEAVTTAEPALSAVTLPFLSTRATAALLDFHVIGVFCSCLGVMVALRVSAPPTVKVSVLRFSVIAVTLSSPVPVPVTVTVLAAVLPSAFAAVMTAVPAAFAVTVPSCATDATDGEPDVQRRVPSAAPSGCGFAASCFVSPTFSCTADGSSENPVSSQPDTVMVHLADRPFSASANRSVVPSPTAVTVPSCVTVRMSSSAERQVSAASAACSGSMSAEIVWVSPTCIVLRSGFSVRPVTAYPDTVIRHTSTSPFSRRPATSTGVSVCASAVTSPSSVTDTTSGLSDRQRISSASGCSLEPLPGSAGLSGSSVVSVLSGARS